MSNGKAKWTAGERVARDFVGPHPTLARRIDAAIARAVKARDADTKRQTVGWVNYMPHDPDEPFDLVHENRRECLDNVSSNGFLCRVVMCQDEDYPDKPTPKAATVKRGNRKGVRK